MAMAGASPLATLRQRLEDEIVQDIGEICDGDIEQLVAQTKCSLQRGVERAPKGPKTNLQVPPGVVQG